MLTPSTIATVKSTAPVLAEHGFTIIQRFYERLFEAHPELKHLFSMRHHVGMVDLRRVADAVLKPDAHYYVCGPQPFMRQQVETLKALGIDEARVHCEVFGTDVFEE